MKTQDPLTPLEETEGPWQSVLSPLASRSAFSWIGPSHGGH